jgi:hypothetical protein
MLGTQSTRANFFNEFREGLGLELSIRQKKIAQQVGSRVSWWLGAENAISYLHAY